jgi:hypothetical protein
MEFKPESWKADAEKKKKENKQFLDKAKRMKGIEKELPDLHDEAFSKIDCLNCANCCKTISPRFKTPDIVRISKHLGMKQSDMIDTYLALRQRWRLCGESVRLVHFWVLIITATFTKCAQAIAESTPTPTAESFLSTRRPPSSILPPVRQYITYWKS